MKSVALGLGLLLAAVHGQSASLSVAEVRCEYRVNPRGMDVRQPRLGWTLKGSQRGERQTAYQILVAAQRETLDQDRGDLWDSGKIASDQSTHIRYGGPPLKSRMACHWKIRVWDRNDQASAWSRPASWTMGLLDKADWEADWIADSPETGTALPKGPVNGYHSQFATSDHTTQWVRLDLPTVQVVDAIRLWPARPFDWQPDTPGFLFPLRFRLEVARNSDFSDARLLVDQTSRDLPNPGTNAPVYRFEPAAAQYLRLEVTKLARRDATNFGFALAELEVLAGERPVSHGARITASGSIDSGAWALAHLADGVVLSIKPASDQGALPATMLRRTFRVATPVRRATAYASALGVYELRINGRRVGDDLLAPEWTNYRRRVQYQTYDVTDLLQPGDNLVAAQVGEGWYAGRLMVVGREAYGAVPAFLLQLEIEFVDGGRQTLSTDGSWQGTTEGPIRSSGIYDGEVYDARKEKPGWDRAENSKEEWRPVRTIPRRTPRVRSSGTASVAIPSPAAPAAVEPEAAAEASLVWQPNEPIRVVRELKPAALTEPKPGRYVFDFGQNMVGWCRLSGRGRAGEAVTLRHAEMLNEDGTVYVANLRGAPQIDRYIPAADGGFTYEPHFTYHGFRFVEVAGLAAPPSAEALVGRVFHSSAPDTGAFACSDPLLNRLMSNIVWTQRANLMSSPNDCPQRDERFGWMGDIQVFSQTAIYHMDLAAFFTKWLQDVRDDQADDGRFPDFAPHPGNPNVQFSGAPAWADAGVFVPWCVYVNYGDLQLLGEHYDSAQRWIDYVRRLNPDLIWRTGRGNDYNDWLNGDWIKETDWPAKGASVPNEVLATAFFARSAELVSRMANVLGREPEAARYAELARDIRSVFNREFVEPDGRIRGDTQAGYALALNFDLLPEHQRSLAAQHMVDGIHRYRDHPSTGIQTTHRLMLELTRNGYSDLAWQLATNRTFPSWGYMIDNGATTIWERWDGYVRGRGFQDPGMNSFNHWALGAVGEWVWRHVAGIQPDESRPGFRHVLIAPRPGGDLTWARSRYQSIRGLVSTHWTWEQERLTLAVHIPPNTRATVRVPTSRADEIREGDQPAARSPGVRLIGHETGAALFEIGSGHYRFQTPLLRSGQSRSG